jgi:translocator protein
VPLQRWLVPITTAATIAVNALANALPINGLQTGAISDSFPVLITPAGYVFAIWGVIYLGLIGYAVWQTLPANARDPRVQALVAPIAIGNVANLAWILLWHYLLIPASLLAMLVLLATLIVVYRRLRATPPRPLRRASTASTHSRPTAERIWARGTFSVYLGWITVATVANVTIVLYDAGWGGGILPAQAWGAIVLLVATAIGVRMLRGYRDVAYAAVLVWAFIGIVVAQSDSTFVAGTAVVGALALAFVATTLARVRSAAA